MSKRYPISRWVLPQVVNPPTSICYQIPVPNDPQHIAAFKGAIYELAKAYSWGNDVGHTAKAVAAVWLAIFDNLEKCSSAAPGVQSVGADEGEEVMIRQNPDNPCELQNSVDGTTWCTWADLSLCIAPPSQPGSGAEQPTPGGGEACYTGRVLGSGKWYLPTVVNTGDTIEIQDPTGAWQDGSFSAWRCPDGNLYFAGGCIASTTTTGTDPLPAQPHMSLVANINGTFYPVLTGGIFTVPGGIVNAPVIFQANDGTLTDNAGEIAFKVCVKNNQALPWTSVLDFRDQSYSALFGTPAYGTWVPGNGYAGTYNSANSLYLVQLYKGSGLSLATWQRVEFLYDSGGSGGPDQGIRVRCIISGAQNDLQARQTLVSGTNQILVAAGNLASVEGFVLDVNSGTTNVNVMLHQVTISGQGTKPPQLP